MGTKYKYPQTLFVRMANPGGDDEFASVGVSPEDVSDESFEFDVAENTARYVLAGTGTIKSTVPVYEEDEDA